MSRARVGVLSLQGDFACHRGALEALDVEAVRVVRPEDLEGLDALVMPGGESTTMLRLMHAGGLRDPLAAFVRSHPVMGTCAGLILLGRGAEGLPYPPLGALDADVERNAYGRQIDSFSAEVDAPALGGPFHAVFIRAPRLRRLGPEVSVVATLSLVSGRAAEPVGVRQGHVVGLAFHPELTADRRFHHWFLTEVAGLSCGGQPFEGAAPLAGAPPVPAGS